MVCEIFIILRQLLGDGSVIMVSFDMEYLFSNVPIKSAC